MNRPADLGALYRESLDSVLDAHGAWRREDPAAMVQLAARVFETFQRGGRVFLLGDGPAAFVAEAAEGEFARRFAASRHTVPLTALRPVSESSAPGGVSPQARAVTLHCRQNDLLVLLCAEEASGGALEAAAAARRLRAGCAALAAKTSSGLLKSVQTAARLAASNRARALEQLLTACHLLADMAERMLGTASAPAMELAHGWREAVEESRSISLARTGPAPELSIVIPTRNRRDILNQAVGKFLEHASVSTEIVLVDDSDDGTDEFIREKYGPTGRVFVIHNEVRKGVSRSVNLGLALAAGRWVIVMTDDVYALKGWDAALIRLMESEPSCGSAVPLLLEADGTIQSMGVIEGTRSAKYPQIAPVYGSLGWNARGRTPDQCPEAHWVRECDYGCLNFMRRELVHQIGGYDIRYEKYCTDVDWGLRIRLAGHRVLYCPKSVAVHLQLSRGEAQATGETLKRDQQRFREKWGIYSPGL